VAATVPVNFSGNEVGVGATSPVQAAKVHSITKTRMDRFM
jgi:hypothetical protein